MTVPAAPWRDRHPWRWGTLAIALAALDLSRHLFANWIPLDEGMLALSASLVRHGAWPHRDFADVYSGGLALFDAGAQALLGDDLRALRIPFAAMSLVWVALLFSCFRRSVSPPAAAGLALLGFLWGPPLYTAAMPSWYLLFLGTAALWCLLRADETREPRWWGAAGVAIGLALAVKINALFFLAAAGCALLDDAGERSGPSGAIILSVGVGGAAAMTLGGWPIDRAALLLLPLLALLVVRWRQERAPRADAPRDPAALVLRGAWLAAGLGIVILPWAGAYLIAGGGHALIEGLFVAPFQRIGSANLLPPRPRLVDLVVVAGIVTLLLRAWPRSLRRAGAVGLVAASVVGVLIARTFVPGAVLDGWKVIRLLAVAAAGSGVIAQLAPASPRARAGVIAGWFAAWGALLQYPFAGANYLAYVAPLLLLAGTAAVALRGRSTAGAALAAALAIWTLGVNHGQGLGSLGVYYFHAPGPLMRLDLARGGLDIPPPEVVEEAGIVHLLDRWNTDRIVAGPDAPEVYYLSGRPFVGREFFGSLGAGWSAATFADLIAASRPEVLVFNTTAFFSRIPIDSVLDRLPARLSADTTIGRFRILRFTPSDTSRFATPPRP